MSDTPSVSLVCCDLASVVLDHSVVERAFAEAIATQGIVPGTETYVRAMVRFDRSLGCPPPDVMRSLFEDDEPRALAASVAFERSFRAVAERSTIVPPEEAAEAFGRARESGVQVCLVSGLSRGSSVVLLDRLGWSGRGSDPTPVDLLLCADDAPRGYPWPDLVLTAILRLGVHDVREVAMVSAVDSGVRAGRRAGAQLIAGLRSGSRSGTALRKAGATHLLDDISAFPALLEPNPKSSPELHTL